MHSIRVTISTFNELLCLIFVFFVDDVLFIGLIFGQKLFVLNVEPELFIGVLLFVAVVDDSAGFIILIEVNLTELLVRQHLEQLGHGLLVHVPLAHPGHAPAPAIAQVQFQSRLGVETPLAMRTVELLRRRMRIVAGAVMVFHVAHDDFGARGADEGRRAALGRSKVSVEGVHRGEVTRADAVHAPQMLLQIGHLFKQLQAILA